MSSTPAEGEKTGEEGGAGNPAASSSSLYELLGVPRDASEKDISRAWKKLSLKCHPDKQVHKSPAEAEEAAKRYLAITQARDVLCDPERRAWYDSLGVDAESIPDFCSRAFGNGEYTHFFGQAPLTILAHISARYESKQETKECNRYEDEYFAPVTEFLRKKVIDEHLQGGGGLAALLSPFESAVQAATTNTSLACLLKELGMGYELEAASGIVTSTALSQKGRLGQAEHLLRLATVVQKLDVNGDESETQRMLARFRMAAFMCGVLTVRAMVRLLGGTSGTKPDLLSMLKALRKAGLALQSKQDSRLCDVPCVIS